jgi:hypothetical protein
VPVDPYQARAWLRGRRAQTRSGVIPPPAGGRLPRRSAGNRTNMIKNMVRGAAARQDRTGDALPHPAFGPVAYATVVALEGS